MGGSEADVHEGNSVEFAKTFLLTEKKIYAAVFRENDNHHDEHDGVVLLQLPARPHAIHSEGSGVIRGVGN